jgi:DNA repair protein RecN (Recombination protein N)
VAQTALVALGGEESDLPVAGAVELLSRAVAACQDGAHFDPALGAEAENLASALALADESVRGLRSYLDAAELDPEALEATEARLLTIADLKRKYGDTVAEVLSYLADARERLDRLERRDASMADLEEQEAALLAEVGRQAVALSGERAKAATHLQDAVERELEDLRLGGTLFRVDITQENDPQGVAVDGRTVAFHPTGIDRVEFLIAPNKGETPRPMARIASGGELARIALALKTILARADTRATLIFDEVDVGVGGRTAPVVGEKLWALTEAGHQVLCVTHMPQVAAYGDCHWLVRKQPTADERTHTELAPLDTEARVDELAAMLAGTVSATARDNARELLERAASRKSPSPRPRGRR